MSDEQLQRDVERIERLVEAVGDEYDEAAVQRIRARLTPDRERVVAAVSLALDKWHSDEGDPRSSAEACADAAIAAMEERE